MKQKRLGVMIGGEKVAGLERGQIENVSSKRNLIFFLKNVSVQGLIGWTGE